MNRIYRLLWNRERGALVVASELAPSHSRAGQTTRVTKLLHAARNANIFGLATLPLFGVLLFAGPAEQASAGVINSGECRTGETLTPGRTTKLGTISGPRDGSGTYSIVAGCEADGAGQDGVTIYGAFAKAGGSGATVTGFGSTASKWASAFGIDAYAQGVGSTAIGFGSQASGLGAVSIGSAAADGTRVLSVADSPTARGAGSLAIGANAQRGAWALNDNAIALGGQATSQANDAVAIGRSAEARVAGAVALGSNSVADRGNAVSIGSTSTKRQIINLAKGTADTDAVNLSQLRPVVNSLGGGAKVNADGSVTGPTYTVAGKTANNVGDALNNLDGSVQAINSGGGIKYFRAMSTGPDARATGVSSVAIGPSSVANAEWSVALGDVSQATARGATALGRATTASGASSLALGQNATASKEGAVALGSNSVADRGNAVSVGSGDRRRQIINVAEGTADSDAVNLSQLKPAVNALGGGAKVNADGSVTGPTYSVGGKTSTNVGDALTVVDGRVTNLSNGINAGTLGLVQQNPVSRVITVGREQDGTQVNFGGTQANRTLTGVAKGEVSSASVQAVNGSQLYNSAASVAKALGGGSQINQDGTDGELSAPRYTINGKALNNVGDALTAVDGRVTNMGDQINRGSIGLVRQDAATGNITVARETSGAQVSFSGLQGARVLTDVAKGTLSATSTEAVNGSQLHGTNQSVANALGGGAQLRPDGTLAGPSYKVDNKTVNNVGDALTSIDGRLSSNSTRITQLGDQISSGGLGLVQQDMSNRDINVAKATDGGRVNFTGSAGDRLLSGVAKGRADNDGVNLSQLKSAVDGLGGGAKVNPDGSVNGPTYTVNNKPVTNVGDALTEVDGRVTNLGDQIGTGSIGLVQQDATTRNITVAKDTDGKQVDFNGTEGARVLAGVANGAVSATSAEAINGSQLHATTKSAADALGGGSQVNPDGTLAGPSYSVGGTTVNNVGDAISNVDGRITNNATAITQLGDNISNGSIGLVQQDATSRDITIAKATDGGRVSLAGAAGDRLLSGVASGTADNDGVNVSQLKGAVDGLGGGAKLNPDGSVTGPTYMVNNKPVTNVGDALTEVDGRVTNLGDQISNGSIGLVQQDAATKTITVAKDTNGKQVDFTGTEGARSLTGVGNGAINAASTEAINGSQLYATSKSAAEALGGGSQVNPDGTLAAPSYSVGGSTVNNVGDALTNIDGRVTTNNTRITQLGDQISNGSIGLVQQDPSNREIYVATNTDGTRINFSGALGARILSGVANGMANNDAVNVSQLRGAVDGLGGGARINPDGSVTGPTYVINNKTLSNVGDALGQLGDQINNGSIGLVQQDATTREITVAKASDGKRVDFSGSQGDRTLGGVARGAADNDSVNVAQLKGTVDGLGGGARVNADGSITGPSYAVGGGTVNNVGDALTNIDSRVSNNAAAIQDLAKGGGVKYLSVKSSGVAASATGAEAVAVGPQSSASGAASVAIGNGAQASADNSVALGAGSVATRANSVSVGNAGNERSISNVAAGTDDADAVNVSQLRNAQAGSVQYDRPSPGAAPDMGSLTLGGPNGSGTTVRNVSNGVAPMDAVNVRQLQSGMADAVGQSRAYTDQRIQAVANDVWDVRRESRAGTASAIAMAGLLQAHEPGENLMSMGLGGFEGQYSMAVGLSGVTDSGRHLYKVQASTNSQRDFGFSVSAGWRW
ncbi:MAG TPA: YadA-like family protein [Stenotrophomonas sp.]|nr:YadA-like family protein [Stenotrophomonas sp.]